MMWSVISQWKGMDLYGDRKDPSEEAVESLSAELTHLGNDE